jgi:predicted pyridoxine 5'-phosphate oxidase superfamily flavin-nucleotide-binding protein
MMQHGFYHEGMLQLQEAADGRRLAEILETQVRHDVLSEEDAGFIATAGFFLIATCYGDVPDCSFKAGDPGFVKVTGPNTIEFPDYDGNFMFRTLGNISKNPNVALLFISLTANPRRLRILGQASLHDEKDIVAAHHGARSVIRITCADIFPNCPRYIPDLSARSR